MLAWKIAVSTMNRVLTVLLAAVIVFGGWILFKAKVLTPSVRREISEASPPAAMRILWTADGSDIRGGGDDPREVFSIGLDHYFGQQVSGASALPLDQIDPAVVSQTDDTARLTATVGGIRYHGELKWGENGWTLIELSREN